MRSVVGCEFPIQTRNVTDLTRPQVLTINSHKYASHHLILYSSLTDLFTNTECDLAQCRIFLFKMFFVTVLEARKVDILRS